MSVGFTGSLGETSIFSGATITREPFDPTVREKVITQYLRTAEGRSKLYGSLKGPLQTRFEYCHDFVITDRKAFDKLHSANCKALIKKGILGGGAPDKHECIALGIGHLSYIKEDYEVLPEAELFEVAFAETEKEYGSDQARFDASLVAKTLIRLMFQTTAPNPPGCHPHPLMRLRKKEEAQ